MVDGHQYLYSNYDRVGVLLKPVRLANRVILKSSFNAYDTGFVAIVHVGSLAFYRAYYGLEIVRMELREEQVALTANPLSSQQNVILIRSNGGRR